MAALARSYYHLGQRVKARRVLADLSSNGRGAGGIFLGAQIAEEMHDYETAEKMYGAIQSTFPDRQALEYHIASIQYREKRFADCEQSLLTTTRDGQLTGRVYNLLAWCQQKQGKLKQAKETLGTAINAAPQDELNYLDLGQVLVAERSLPAALALIRKASVLFPSSVPVAEMQGTVESKMGQFGDAITSYSRAARLDPSRATATLGLADAQFSAGMEKDAISTLNAATKRFPKDARLKALYGSVLLKMAETGEPGAELQAKRMFESALALDESLPSAHYEMGKLALKGDRPAEAARHLEAALRLDPENTQAHFVLSRAYRRMGHNEEADREMALYEKLKAGASASSSPATPNQ
jgi:tetratricopeptide (TPR) repeat protein